MSRRRVHDDPPPPAPNRQGAGQGAAPVPIRTDLVNEQLLIASMATDPDALARVGLRAKPDSFFGKGHPEIFSAFAELRRQGLAYSPATLRQVSGGAIDESYVEKLVAAYPSAINISHHLDALEWDRARVEAVRGPLSRLLKAVQDPTQSPDAVRAIARTVGTAFDGHGAHRFLRDPNELVRSQIEEIRKRKDGKAHYPYGIPLLDDDETGARRLITAATPGEMTVVVGVPGSAKSTFTARIALGLMEQGRRVLYGAWEIKSGRTLELLACMRLGMSRTRFLEGTLTDEEIELVREQMEIIAGYIRFFSMPFGRERGARVTNDQNLDVIHTYLSDSGCDAAIFDLWKRALRYTDPDDEEQALIRQQAMLQECEVHGILVQQLRAKDVETRANQRPTREAIKGSGAWFEVPDTILGLYRPALSKRVDDNVAEVIGMKQRYGKFPFAVEFDWDGDRGSFENGRTVPYDPPLAAAENDMVSNFKVNEEDGRRRGGGGRR